MRRNTLRRYAPSSSARLRVHDSSSRAFSAYPRRAASLAPAVFLCPQVSRGGSALSCSSSNSRFLSDVSTSNDGSIGATQWQFQEAESSWNTVLRCIAPFSGLVREQDANFHCVPSYRHAKALADANTHWQSLSLRYGLSVPLVACRPYQPQCSLRISTRNVLSILIRPVYRQSQREMRL